MSIRSMTGFGKGQAENKYIIASVELRALNGKHLELNLRIPKGYQSNELELRKIFQNELERGSVQVNITVEDRLVNTGQYHVNKDLVKHYYKEFSEIGFGLSAQTDDLLGRIMLLPEVLTIKEEDIQMEENWAVILDATREAIANLQSFRMSEGEVLGKAMQTSIHKILELLAEVETLESERIKTIRDRINGNLEELIASDKIDRNRFEQELIYYLEKLDIAEEKTRLKQHCEYFLENLNLPGGGRKLGFISQEIGREINTLGSKANHVGIQKAVIGMKEELEKIKEQGLNIL